MKLSGIEISCIATWPVAGIHKTVRYWNVIYMTCSMYMIKSVTALTQLNVKLAKHTSRGRLSKPIMLLLVRHLVALFQAILILPFSLPILVFNQACSLIVKLLRTLRLSSWRQWMRVTPMSHKVYPSACKGRVNLYSYIHWLSNHRY